MKGVKYLVFTTLFLFSSWIVAAPLKVIIDPGHGGSDTGAVQGEAKEAEIALKVSLYLRALLEHDTAFSSALTRESDQNLSLQDRVDFAKNNHGDLLLSIHANASADPKARGVEFYFQNHLPADEESLFLANVENKVSAKATPLEENSNQKSDVTAILEDLKRNYHMRNSFALSQSLLHRWLLPKNESHNVRQAPFFVVSKSSMPAVLVELGFLTNPKEAQKLLSKDYQKDLALKIYSGLKDYKESIDKSPLARLQ